MYALISYTAQMNMLCNELLFFYNNRRYTVKIRQMQSHLKIFSYKMYEQVMIVLMINANAFKMKFNK